MSNEGVWFLKNPASGEPPGDQGLQGHLLDGHGAPTPKRTILAPWLAEVHEFVLHMAWTPDFELQV